MTLNTTLLETMEEEFSTEGSIMDNETLMEVGDLMCLETYNATAPSPRLLRFIVYGFLLTTVGLLGVAGNLISITILSRPKMRSSINCCLIGLTSFDMIVTTTSVLMFGLPEICEYTHTMLWYSEGVYQRVTPFVFPLALVAQTGSVYLTVTVTVERYIAVCRPLRARYLCTYGRAKVYVISVALFSILYNIPRFWEVSNKECNVDGETFVIVVPSALRLNPYYIEIYIMWVYLIVMYLVPFLSLMIFNFFIYKEVRAANHERQQLSRLQRKEIGLAVMLLVVVTVFFVCNVLAFIINVLELLDITIAELTMSSNLLVTINSSVNFIIYCIFGQKFRKLFLRMFCSGFLFCARGRDASLDSAAYGNNSIYGESRTLTNGKMTQTIRLSSWNGSHQSGRSLHPHDIHGHHGHSCSGTSWRASRYSSIPLGDSSTPRTASTSFTPSRSPSLVPQRTPSENVHVL
ncbi:FMRFamide receptor-like [Homarus americanus]|uniref:FMRFamide receptor-like 1 n=1 Tax=Homarus americanus TaxID=6706 RepID=A0A8J5K178_HOMAM|nr:FMRFamide receptor-like [Homarus americanus]XP_042223251.1 FMRFamide receptor-like [Homarus americanus]XP_042223252.1 FMRFamide receptor-like [Homarus americanus]KAG7168255.1 FMRFamide receptor-like 1 [Homarus americanus]